MEFRRVEVNSQYRSLRFLSTQGHWELGLSPYHHGMRVRMGRAGGLPKMLDCCLGPNEALYGPVLLALIKKLDAIDETSSSAELQQVFPWQGISPDVSVFLERLLESGSRGSFIVAKNLQ